MAAKEAPGGDADGKPDALEGAAGDGEVVYELVELVDGVDVGVGPVAEVGLGGGGGEDGVDDFFVVAEAGGVEEGFDFALVEELGGEGGVAGVLALFLVNGDFEGLSGAVVGGVGGAEFDAEGVGAEGAFGVVGGEGVEVVEGFVLAGG
jgi:hypothetical protein